MINAGFVRWWRRESLSLLSSSCVCLPGNGDGSVLYVGDGEHEAPPVTRSCRRGESGIWCMGGEQRRRDGGRVRRGRGRRSGGIRELPPLCCVAAYPINGFCKEWVNGRLKCRHRCYHNAVIVHAPEREAVRVSHLSSSSFTVGEGMVQRTTGDAMTDEGEQQ